MSEKRLLEKGDSSLFQKEELVFFCPGAFRIRFEEEKGSIFSALKWVRKGRTKGWRRRRRGKGKKGGACSGRCRGGGETLR